MEIAGAQGIMDLVFKLFFVFADIAIIVVLGVFFNWW